MTLSHNILFKNQVSVGGMDSLLVPFCSIQRQTKGYVPQGDCNNDKLCRHDILFSYFYGDILRVPVVFVVIFVGSSAIVKNSAFSNC